MTYIMSDIHGNLRRFLSVMEKIHLQPEDTLYVLGDVMDRYPDGVIIMQELMAMPNAKLLMGNHEYMMLCVMDPETIQTLDEFDRYGTVSRWYRNGGEVTREAMRALKKKDRDKIISYVRNLPLAYELEVNGKPFRLIHAAPLELYRAHWMNYSNSTEYAVWHRWPLDEPFPQETDTTFIFGHTGTYHYQEADPMRIYFGDHRIGLDCGSG